VELPDLYGMTEDEAAAELDELGLKILVRSRVNDDVLEAGLVVSQERPAHSMVKEGFTLAVNLSKGNGENTEHVSDAPSIPNVVGKTQDEASYLLKTWGYDVGNVTHEVNQMPKDFVIRQFPSAGSEEEPGTKVDIVISDGDPTPEKVAVPNLLTLTQDAAKRQLEGAGLHIGEIEQAPSATFEAGRVSAQEREAGTEVDAGSSISITISTGPSTEGPRTVPINIDFGSAANEDFLLTVLFTDHNGQTSTVVNNVSRNKSTGGDVIPVTGTETGTVYVLFDGAQVMSFLVDFSNGTVN
jgi:serine/threonine-protein kinase